jgi:hypothetical protein
MIASMLDLADIDRQLEQLGQPQESALLLDSNLGTDRSLERLDAELRALAEGAESAQPAQARAGAPQASSAASRGLRRHSSWRPPPPASTAQIEQLSARDTLRGIPNPALPLASAPAAASSAEYAESEADTTERELPLSAARDEAEPRLSLSGEYEDAKEPELSFTEAQERTELASETASVASERAPSAPPGEPRPSMKALLERDLDPHDFPKTPPPPAPDAAGAATPATEDDFELLIEDDEILEIEDDDVVD